MRSLALLVFTLRLSPAYAIPAEGHKVMISAPNHYAVEVGQRIAERGGNVADVAVAVGLSLSVTAPYYAALGGGGFALIKMGEKVQALDFRETAPKAAHKDYYLNLPVGASQNGAHAVAVPGFPAGLYELHRKFGKLKWELLFSDTLAMAEKGFPVTGGWVNETEQEKSRFNKAGLKYFFKKIRRLINRERFLNSQDYKKH
jgi:gamma-glutamyltranspeptidase/glutathione hydrolase